MSWLGAERLTSRSIFEKSVNMIETLNNATSDVDAAPYQWHIGRHMSLYFSMELTHLGGHAAFQAIMHVLSELRNPHFDAPDRQRAIRALRLSRRLKEQNHTKPWQAVKSMIDRLIGEEETVKTGTENTASLTYPIVPEAPPAIPLDGLSYTQPMASYPQVDTSQMMMEPTLEPQPQLFPQLQNTEQPNFHWNDINFDNMIGDTQPTEDMPQFDFVSI